LENANDQLDNNFSRLEAAGLSGYALAEKLAIAEDRINDLEDQIRTAMQRNKATLAVVTAQRDEHGLVSQFQTKADIVSRTSDSKMKEALNIVHHQMDTLKTDMTAERSRLQRDNGRLNDLISELRLRSRAEAESFGKELERISEDMRAELQAAHEERQAAMKERDSLKRVC